MNTNRQIDQITDEWLTLAHMEMLHGYFPTDELRKWRLQSLEKAIANFVSLFAWQ